MRNPIAWKLRKELSTTLTLLNSADLLDGARAVEPDELGYLAARRLADRARRLRMALGRAARGEYGICEECGAYIGDHWLAVLPDAVTCLGCQEKR
jgi:DnaK suppressor protein